MSLPSSPNTVWSSAFAPKRTHALTVSSLIAIAWSSSALAQANRLECWGRNVEGQCNVPSTLGPVNAAAGGVYHTIALRPDGTVTAWGLNAEGQTAVPAGLGQVIAIAAGSFHNAVVKSDGTVVCWGRNVEGQCTVPAGVNSVAAVSAGWKHTVALRGNGSVAAWGAAGSAQVSVPAGLGAVSQVSAGSQHNVALLADGTVRCWGAGTSNSGVSPNFGQSIVPVGLAGVSAVAAGANHSVALKSDGTVVCWGQTAFGISTPPAGLSGVVAIAAGNAHTLAMKSDRSIVGWGSNSSGQLTLPATLRVPTAIFAGGQHSGAITVNAPSATLVSAAGSVCHGATGSIDVTVADVTTTSWSGPNGFVSSSVDLNGLPAGVYTLTATGAGGSTQLAVTVPTLPDIAAPVVTAYSNALSVDARQDCTALVPNFVPSVVASDNCSATAALTITQTPAAGSVAQLGQSPVTIRVRDESGNETVLGATLTVAGTAATNYIDADQDGFGNPATAATYCIMPAGHVANGSDCNDGEAAVHPGATETCNDIDDDCTGGVDNGLTFLDYFVDGDNDGYGAGQATSSCRPIAGSVTTSGDCNDASSAIRPGATETCNDIDDDCVGGVDNGLTFLDYFVDADHDGYGAGQATSSCRPIAGSVTTSGDCNDGEAAVHPGVTETCNDIDDDCVGGIDDGLTFLDYFVDADSDGYGAGQATSSCRPIAGSVTTSGDCNDGEAAVHPGATETCNDIDDDCVGGVDNGLTFLDYFVDADGDGYGAGQATSSCRPIAGSVTVSGDCNDGAASVFPTATEVCNDIDEDCDGIADDGIPTNDYFRDADADGYGNAAVIVRDCDSVPPTGHVTDSTDCNDGAAGVHPGADERCADLAVDNDCDGSTAESEAIDLIRFYADVDDDGAGDAATSLLRCEMPQGFVANSNDQCPANGALVLPITYFRDFDQDEFGSATDTVAACDLNAPAGFVTDSSDCNDAALLFADVDGDGHGAGDLAPCGVPSNDDECPNTAARISPIDWYGDADQDGAGDPAVISNACDAPAGFVGNTNDLCPANGSLQSPVTYYIDGDADGFGSPAATTSVCETSAPAGYSAVSTDCNDAVASTFPGAPELCNETDDDCDTVVDEDLVFSNYYRDADGDSHGDSAVTESSCTGTPSTGFVRGGGDCDDGRAEVHALAPFHIDADQDGFGVSQTASLCEVAPPAGYSSNALDCNDASAGVNPGATEVCDAADTDENCSGAADDADLGVSEASKSDFFADADADGFTVAGATRFCDIKPGFLAARSAAIDCNDGNAAINPGVAETCNGIDDDCTGAADDGLTFTTYYRDADSDGFGSPTVIESNCLGAPSSGFVGTGGDCDDADALANPAGIELCSNLAVDNDCDGSLDESEAGDRFSIYADVDGDGAGDPAGSILSCTVRDGFSENANDQCPSNGALITQATYYLDSDGDGAGDAAQPMLSCESAAPAGYSATSNDGCPSDPAKVAPGTCGCGTADTDTDSDGTADCHDQCPNDPAKTAPGSCGCGTADTDTDSDGTADCNDQCPNDPMKIAPGTCGCGTADTDTDGDGTADCASFVLALDPAATSIRGGQFLVVRVSSSWPAVNAPARGIALQLAVRFDHTRLRLDTVDNAIIGAPFTLELARVVGVDTDPASTDPLRGTLRYAAGLNVFGSPADTGMVAAGPLVDLVFEVLPGVTDCGIEDLVRVVPALGSEPIRTRLTTEEANGSSGTRNPTPTPMIPVGLDFDGPVLSGVPTVVALPTDAGSAIGAVVAQPTVTAADGCDGTVTPTLLVTFPNGATSTSWPAQFPNMGTGVSLATWTATDAAGNATSATMRIEVANYQRLDATIVLQGAFNGHSNRPIRISGPAFSELFAVAMTGQNGQVSDIHVPVQAAYPCLAAKDLAHSLTMTTAAAVVDRTYRATFVLRQGDSNDDDSVDIYDFSLFAADRGLASGASARSNFNADIAINNADFAFISTNFFHTGDSCAAGAQGREPTTRVSVKELRRQGLGHLVVADINHDGWVDLRDIQLYMQGQGITPESIEVPLEGNE